jgi:hypothetical protein
LIRAIAVIRPETVDGPGIARSCGRVGVPELGLEKETARSVESAGILGGGAVIAAELGVI